MLGQWDHMDWVWWRKGGQKMELRKIGGVRESWQDRRGELWDEAVLVAGGWAIEQTGV